MARRKTATEDARDRAAKYARRTKGLQKQAKDLSTLCGVPVALVCAPAAGDAGARLVWESEAGVLDRYRGAAVTRVRHTHRSYLEAELGKETAKLARARPGALPDWDPALDDMTLDEVRGVLEAIDATLRAAADRMAALGLPADGRLDEQVALAPGDNAASNDATAMPQQLGLEDMGNAGFQMQMVPCHGGNNDGGLLEQLFWDDRFPMLTEYGLEYVGGGNNYDVGAIAQAPAGYGDNADCSWPNLTMCYADDGSRDAVLPSGYYYPKFVDGTLAPELYSSQVVTGRDYIDKLPLEHPMGMEENFTNLGNSYTAQWQAEEFQSSGTNSSIDENYTYLDNTYAVQWQAEEIQLSDTNSSMDENFTNLDNGYTVQWHAEEFQRSDTNSSIDENYTYLDNTYAAQLQAEEFQLSDTNSSIDENYTYLDNSYAAQWQAEEFQRSDTGTGHYQHQCSDPGTSSSSQAFSLSLLDQWRRS